MTGTARLVSPSGPATRSQLVAGVSQLQLLGVEAVWDEDVLARAAYLAGSDRRRADELVAALETKPDALWMVRGGYGAIRTLEALADRLPACPPVPLWAFSDGTALLSAWGRLGWPAWLAPPVIQLPRLTRSSLRRIGQAWQSGFVAPFDGLEPLVAGRATGPMAGGNLCVLASLIGTRWQPALDGRIVVLEDVGEPAYKVDRLFTQLRLSGALDGCAGLVLGRFTDVDDQQSRLIEGFFEEVAPGLGVPVAAGLPVGHGRHNAPVPFGPPATLETAADGSVATLRFGR